MIYTIEEIREIVRPIANKYGIKRVYLFGSYARGEANENSDIDILVDVAGSEIATHMADFGDVLEDLTVALKKEVDLITVQSIERDKRFNRRKYFVEEVEKDRRDLFVA
ncbi:MAG: nucleotidyltransferase domain-containing protein [Streptococcaceae bacterium]|jgi:predicted nucleotidyltransferase|nr:nucleotidyltransferase domain-containing protein [Streptococcaceae bacterium]